MTLVYKPEAGDVLIPRQYQEEIFLKAQQKNVIAVLDTGSGKTLISALLIKWIASQGRSQKKVIFLVPKVPLVEQQGNFIAQHTALRVAQVHSEVSAGVTDRARWSNLFSQADVLVMTGERSSVWKPHFFFLIEFRANILERAYALSLEHEQGMPSRAFIYSSLFLWRVSGFTCCLR